MTGTVDGRTLTVSPDGKTIVARAKDGGAQVEFSGALARGGGREKISETMSLIESTGLAKLGTDALRTAVRLWNEAQDAKGQELKISLQDGLGDGLDGFAQKNRVLALAETLYYGEIRGGQPDDRLRALRIDTTQNWPHIVATMRNQPSEGKGFLVDGQVNQATLRAHLRRAFDRNEAEAAIGSI